MSVVVVEKTVDVLVTFAWRSARGEVHPPESVLQGKPNRLRLYFSLLGETEPVLSPLTNLYTFDERAPAYRYDWVFGITPVKADKVDWWWDWTRRVREKRAFAVQVLVDGNGCGCTVSEFAAYLLGLQPSMDTASWLERNSEGLGNTLREAASMAEPMSRRAASVLNASALMSNFVTSSDRNAKHWFIYRFLDEEKQCVGIEWNIHRSVLQQYGPLLRGSLVLSFHGTVNQGRPLKLLLRPRLGFSGTSQINYLPKFEELEKTDPVALEITPKTADRPSGSRWP